MEQLEDRRVPATLSVGTGQPLARLQDALGAAVTGDRIQIEPGAGVTAIPIVDTQRTLDAVAGATSITLSSNAIPVGEVLVLNATTPVREYAIDGHDGCHHPLDHRHRYVAVVPYRAADHTGKWYDLAASVHQHATGPLRQCQFRVCGRLPGCRPPSTPFWGSPPTTSFPNDTISGDDSTASGSAVTIPTATSGPRTYLTTVQFQAPSTASPGDSFTISLVNDPAQTFFNDASGTAIAYTSNPGTVLITSAATPEPSGFLLAGTACAGGRGLFWRKRRGKGLS